MPEVPVLMYHAIEDADHPAGSLDPGEQLYVLRREAFQEQMSYLHRQGFRTYLLDELHGLAELPEKAIVLTFDDGHQSNFTLALPILQELGFRAEFFVTTGWIGSPRFLTPLQIRGLSEAGMGIGSHGVTHRYLDDLTEAQREEEYLRSKEVLERIVCKPVASFSFPGGRMPGGSLELGRRSGYRFLLSSQLGSCRRVSHESQIPRYAISHRTSFERFVSLVHGKRTVPMILRYRLLRSLKSILGNRLYDGARDLLTR